MYRLQNLNIITETENEMQKDRLIMQGYTLLDHQEEEKEEASDNSSSEVVSSQDYKKYKAEELRKIATEKNLSVTEGMTKKELVELLEKNEKSEEDESA